MYKTPQNELETFSNTWKKVKIYLYNCEASEHYAFPFKENLKFDSITVFRKQGPKQTLNNSSQRALQCFKPIYLFWEGSP